MAKRQRFAIPSAKGLIFSPFYGFIARETEIIAEIGLFDFYDFRWSKSSLKWHTTKQMLFYWVSIFKHISNQI